MHIEHLTLDALIPYARNARTHSDEQTAQIAGSIREFGFTNPVLIDGEGGIIAGHGRVMAARKLGLADVPCIRLAHLTDAQKRAYIIADNKLALNAGWDEAMLALELQELQAIDYDMSLTGFMGDEIDEIMTSLDDYFDGQDAAEQSGAGSLSDRFMIPPFSVLNAREGWWQDRKRAWIALGIKSELGRGGTSSTSARVGPDDEATYSPIGGKRQRQAAAPGQRATTAKSSAATARGCR